MATVNVQEVIDSRKLSGFQVLVVSLCALIVLIDGFDTQAIGYVAPAIVRSWHVDRAALTPVFSAGLLGLMLGALAFGPVADRFGRKPVLIFCTLFFGVMSLLTSTADSVQSLIILRFITGLGLGGAMPNAIALTTEYAPKRIRATTIMIMFCGFSLGAALGGVAAASLISHFGWKSVFVLGGIVPCLAFPFLAALLPESIRYLVVQGERGDRVGAILRRIDPAASIPAGATFTVEEHKAKGFVVRQLFANGRGPFTLLIWVVFFMSLLDLYFVTNWLPTIITDSGIAVSRAALITAMYQVGGILGTLLLGRLFDRFSPFVMLALTYLAASVFVLLIGTVGTSIGALVLTVDLQVLGQRHRDVKNGLSVPPRMTLTNILNIATKPRWVKEILSTQRRSFGNIVGHVSGVADTRSLGAWTNDQFDPTLSWGDVKWIRDQWKGKLIVKGIMDSGDAEKAVNAGADAIVVSNHGGRQLDGAPSSIAALPRIAGAVGTRTEVLIDGGITSGQNLMRALALGAKGAMIGKAMVYGLGASGEEGVRRVIGYIQKELDITMALTGVNTVSEIDRRVLADWASNWTPV